LDYATIGNGLAKLTFLMWLISSFFVMVALV
ncbi:MAG: hypothetical protein ACI9VO_001795, partial [Colwellia sp.]